MLSSFNSPFHIAVFVCSAAANKSFFLSCKQAIVAYLSIKIWECSSLPVCWTNSTVKRSTRKKHIPQYEISLLTNYDYPTYSVPASLNYTKPARPIAISPSMPSIPASHILTALIPHYNHDSHKLPPLALFSNTLLR